MERFYKNNINYHEMTSSGDKIKHPQAEFLQCLVKSDGTYAEIGCGGGAITRLISKTASVVGIDFALHALTEAEKVTQDTSVSYVNAKGENIPFSDNSFDGCYAFEVLEHVWDPLCVCREMVRIVKEGGFILISVPLVFSLDLHLFKRPVARIADYSLALVRFFGDIVTGKVYRNVEPDLDHGVYPDCDMITAISPANLASALEEIGCNIIFWDTTYMCAHRIGSGTNLNFQRNTARKIIRNFGDHLLLLARKK
ncbi:MAG: class I SAM-dependent methyltransferase [Kiritimatiellae bacterium]|nr:class I SAM-dependent methyltransferase [Kiritimatiellia bacterium]MDD5521894.1 class I SAM-dependent methyltransferase [Kiritimatiellia bacterium]